MYFTVNVSQFCTFQKETCKKWLFFKRETIVCFLRKVPKFSENFAVIILKFKKIGQTKGFSAQNVQMEWQTMKTLIRLTALCTVCPDLPVRKLKIITVFAIVFFISEPLTYKADKLSTKLPHLVIFMMIF